MSDSPSAFDPTHVLLVAPSGSPLDLATREVIERSNAALFAALEHVDEVDLFVDLEWCAAEFPEVADALAARTTRIEADESSAHFRGDPSALRRELRFLLDRTTHHRVDMVDRIELRRDGEITARFVPARDELELDAADETGVVDAVRTAATDAGARLVSGGVLVEWTDGDRRLRIDPPALDVEGWGVADLRHLEAAVCYPRKRRIELHWDDEYDGRGPDEPVDADGLLERVRSTIAPPPRAPPAATTVESGAAFEAVADAFRRLAEHFEFEVSRVDQNET